MGNSGVVIAMRVARGGAGARVREPGCSGQKFRAEEFESGNHPPPQKK